MAKELVLIPKKKYEELMQNKQPDLLCNAKKGDIDKNTEPTEDFKISQSSDRHFTVESEDVDKRPEPIKDLKPPQCSSDGRFPVQSGKGLIVRQRFIGKGLPGISDSSLQKTKKSTKRKKKKTKIQWLIF